MNEERDARAPVIETRRLVLRPIARSDTEALRRISNEPLVRRYLWDSEPVSGEKIREVIDESARMFSAEGIGLFGVRLRGTQEIVGFCGFMRDADGPGEVELAYELVPDLWGRGIATEAARACLRYAFLEWGLDRVVAGVDAPNAASTRVLEKLGMKPVGPPNSEPGASYFALDRSDYRNPETGRDSG